MNLRCCVAITRSTKVGSRKESPVMYYIIIYYFYFVDVYTGIYHPLETKLALHKRRYLKTTETNVIALRGFMQVSRVKNVSCN